MELTDTEAEYLLKLEKHCEEDKTFEYPFQGGKITIPLLSVDKREEFLLAVNRMRVNLAKKHLSKQSQKKHYFSSIGFRLSSTQKPRRQRNLCTSHSYL